MATQWPVVHARLLALLRDLPGWTDVEVFDGPNVTRESPFNFATVGYAADEPAGGSFSHERSGGGYQVEETGTVRCELVSWSGDTDLVDVRSTAFALMDALEVEIRRDQTLGVMPQGATSSLEVDVVPIQSDRGAQQRLPFTVRYFVTT